MTSRRRRTRFLSVVLMLLLSSLVFVASADSDFRRQIATVGGIHCLITAIESYQHDHNSLPGSIEALLPEYLLDKNDCRTDGWDRRLLFYSTEVHYVIMSFGKNGKPDGQAAPPGGLGPEGDFDQDIILIDGEWAQSPPGVDR